MNYRVLKTKQILDHLTQLLHSQVWRLRPLGARWILWVARRQVFHPNSGPEYGASWFIALLEWPWTFESSFWNVRLVIIVYEMYIVCYVTVAGTTTWTVPVFPSEEHLLPQTLCPEAQLWSEKMRIPELHARSRGVTESTLHSGMPFSSSATPGKAQICRAWDPEMYEQFYNWLSDFLKKFS